MDERIRILERNWAASGELEDHERLIAACAREGVIPPVELEIVPCESFLSSEASRIAVYYQDKHNTNEASLVLDVDGLEVDCINVSGPVSRIVKARYPNDRAVVVGVSTGCPYINVSLALHAPGVPKIVVDLSP